MGRHVRSLATLATLVALVLLAAVPAPAVAVPGWEPMPPGLLQAQKSTLDPDADSEISARHVWAENTTSLQGVQLGRYSLVIGLVWDVFERVKVFTPRGAERWAQIRIEAPEHVAEIRDFEVRTILPDGTVQTATAGTLRQETVFDEDDHRVLQWSFAPRGVVPGCVIEFRYRIEYTSADFHFAYLALQAGVPIREVTYELTPIKDVPFYYVALRSTPMVKQDIAHNHYRFALHDVPAFRREPDMPPERSARAGVVVYYGLKGAIQPADFWTQFGKAETGPFDSYAEPDRAARRLVADSIGTSGSPVERLQRMVEWCRTRLRPVPDDPDSLEALHVSATANGTEVLRLRAGTSFGLNAALATLCDAAGFDVRLLRTASHAEFPFEQGMLSGGMLPRCETAVRFNGSWLSLSATARYADWDMLPWDEEGDYGLVCDRDSTCFILTPLAAAENSAIVRNTDLVLQPDGTLEGELRLAFTGHWNESIREALEPGDLTLQQVLEHRRLWNGTECEVNGIESDNLSRLGEPLRVRAHVRIHNHAVPGAKRLLLEPAVLRAHEPPRFTASERRLEVAFEFGHSEVDTVRIRAGAGWRLQAGAAPRALDGGDLGSYASAVTPDSSGSALTFTRTLRIAPAGKLAFPVSTYAGVRRFFEAVHEQDQLTLTFAPAAGSRP